MAELTLEALAKRVDELEKLIKEHVTESRSIPPRKSWRHVIGLSEDNEFTRDMRAEIERAREAERRAAREERGEA